MIEVSVVLATYNRAEKLRACLEALGRQTHPPADFEVVVVVDGSTDGTRALLAGLTPSYALRVIEQENTGKGGAVNRGVTAAQGRICVLLDDDIIAAPELVAEHARLHREETGVVGIGRLTLAARPDSDWFARAFAREWDAHYAHLDGAEARPSWQDCYGGNLSVARSTFLAVGGFATGLRRTFDLELGYRLGRHGCRFRYLPAAQACQHEQKDFRALARDAELAGAGCVASYRQHPAMLPQLLGRFAEARVLETVFRRRLLALDLPPWLLERFGRLLSAMGSARTDAWFRFLHRYCFWRGVRHAVGDADEWHRLSHGTPILMYHAFGPRGEPASRYILPGRRFARQMAWLKRLGFQPLSLDAYLEYRREHRLPPARSVVITMDDGYADTFTVAFPILSRHGFPATVFLVSRRLAERNDWDAASQLRGRPIVSAAQVDEMRAGGVGVGAHTRTHRRLTTLPPEQARDEIAGSRADLADVFGTSASCFSYPYGEYDASHVGMVEEAGFAGACSVHTGLNTPATPVLALRRVEIWGTDSVLRFLVAVLTGHRSQVLWQQTWSRWTGRQRSR